MGVVLSLRDIVDAIDSQSNESEAYLDPAPGAFRHFRGAVERLGLLDAWYRYREEAIQQTARDWLEEHKLPYK